MADPREGRSGRRPRHPARDHEEEWEYSRAAARGRGLQSSKSLATLKADLPILVPTLTIGLRYFTTTPRAMAPALEPGAFPPELQHSRQTGWSLGRGLPHVGQRTPS